MTIREGEGRARVTVHMGTCGIAAGARDIMDALSTRSSKAKRPGRHRDDVRLRRAVQPEPMATVELKASRP